MKSLLEAVAKFAGEPEQKPGDQVRGTEKATKSKDGKHPFLKRLVGDSKEYAVKNKLIKEFEEFKETFEHPQLGQWVQSKDGSWSGEVIGVEGDVLIVSDGHETRKYHPEDLATSSVNEDSGVDTITLDVPLMIRLLEYAREDAKTDMDLHSIAEKLISLGQNGNALSMDDYSSIVDQLDELAPSAPGTAIPPSPQELQKANQEKQNLQKNLTQLKSAGVNIDPAKAAQTLTKVDANAPMSAVDKDTISQMAPAIQNVVSNPQLAGQLTALIKKAGQGQ